MIRKLLLIMACVCVAVVLSEVVALALLWRRGALSDYNLREIQLVLSGQVSPEADPIPVAPSKPEVAYEAVKTARAVRILDIQARESNLQTLHSELQDEHQRIQALQASFRSEQQAFEQRLADLESQLNDSATEQARGVLMAMSPAAAAEKLMSLTLDDDTRLLKGMPEKTIAKILKEFADSKEKLERGQQLFRAIYQGDPQRAVLDDARKRLEPPPASASPQTP